MRAGTPTATQWQGSVVTTTDPAPTLLPAPMVMGPSTQVPAPSSTPWPVQMEIVSGKRRQRQSPFEQGAVHNAASATQL